MTERQIASMSESDALSKGVWILWVMICQPDRMYSKADVRAWVKNLEQEKVAKAAGKGKK